MTKDAREESLVNDILLEYRALRDALRSLAQIVEKREAPTTETLDRDLKILRKHMERLFEYEEKGGLFDDLLSLLPNESIRIEAVKKEHPVLLARIDELIVKTGRPKLPELGVLRKELRLFVRVLESHEGREDSLVRRPYYSEEGTVD